MIVACSLLTMSWNIAAEARGPNHQELDPKSSAAHIVVLPGFAASSLYSCASKQAPIEECSIIYGVHATQRQDLALKQGAEYRVGEIDLKALDAYRAIRNFIAMQSKKYPTVALPIENIAVIPYDWRYSVTELGILST